jgi:hypothetical protein
VECSVVAGVSDRFKVDLSEVAWHGAEPGEALQFVAPSVGDAWFDPDQLRNKAIERNGESGARCPESGMWRWMPLTFARLLPIIMSPEWAQHDVIASPEWFGAGHQTFCQILMRRELAELIAVSSSEDFKIREVD